MQNAFNDYSSAVPIGQLTQDGVDYYESDDPAGNGHYFVHVALYRWFLDRIDNLIAPAMPAATTLANVQECLFQLERKAGCRYIITKKNGHLLFTEMNCAGIGHIVNIPANHY